MSEVYETDNGAAAAAEAEAIAIQAAEAAAEVERIAIEEAKAAAIAAEAAAAELAQKEADLQTKAQAEDTAAREEVQATDQKAQLDAEAEAARQMMGEPAEPDAATQEAQDAANRALEEAKGKTDGAQVETDAAQVEVEKARADLETKQAEATAKSEAATVASQKADEAHANLDPLPPMTKSIAEEADPLPPAQETKPPQPPAQQTATPPETPVAPVATAPEPVPLTPDQQTSVVQTPVPQNAAPQSAVPEIAAPQTLAQKPAETTEKLGPPAPQVTATPPEEKRAADPAATAPPSTAQKPAETSEKLGPPAPQMTTTPQLTVAQSAPAEENKPWYDGLGRLANSAGDSLKGAADMTGKVAGAAWNGVGDFARTVTTRENYAKLGNEFATNPAGVLRDGTDAILSTLYTAGPGLAGTVVGLGGQLVKEAINVPSNTTNMVLTAVNQDKNFKAPTLEGNVFAAVTGKVEEGRKAAANWSTNQFETKNGSEAAVEKYGEKNAKSSAYQVGEVIGFVGEFTVGVATGTGMKKAADVAAATTERAARNVARSATRELAEQGSTEVVKKVPTKYSEAAKMADRLVESEKLGKAAVTRAADEAKLATNMANEAATADAAAAAARTPAQNKAIRELAHNIDNSKLSPASGEDIVAALGRGERTIPPGIAQFDHAASVLDKAKNAARAVYEAPGKLKEGLQAAEKWVGTKVADAAQDVSNTAGFIQQKTAMTKANIRTAANDAVSAAKEYATDAMLSRIPNNVKADLAVMTAKTLDTAEAVAKPFVDSLSDAAGGAKLVKEGFDYRQVQAAKLLKGTGEWLYERPGKIVNAFIPNTAKPYIADALDKAANGVSSVVTPITKAYGAAENLVFNDTSKYLYTRGLGATATYQVANAIVNPGNMKIATGEDIKNTPLMQKIMSAPSDGKLFGIILDKNNPTDNFLSCSVRTPDFSAPMSEWFSNRMATAGRTQGQNVAGNGPNGLIEMLGGLLLPKAEGDKSVAGMKTNLVRGAEVTCGFNAGNDALGFTGLANVSAASAGYNVPYSTFTKDSQGRAAPGVADAGAISPIGFGGILGLRLGSIVPAVRVAGGLENSMLGTAGSNGPPTVTPGPYRSPKNGPPTPVIMTNPAHSPEDGKNLSNFLKSLIPGYKPEPQPTQPQK